MTTDGLIVALRVAILACCVLGFAASRTMHAKARADRAGRLSEASVVQTPRARVFGGVDNAAIGLVYYPAVALAIFLFAFPLVRIATVGAALAAALMSVFLIYSLLFVTRMKCSNCMLAHAVNLALLGLLAALSAALR